MTGPEYLRETELSRAEVLAKRPTPGRARDLRLTVLEARRHGREVELVLEAELAGKRRRVSAIVMTRTSVPALVLYPHYDSDLGESLGAPELDCQVCALARRYAAASKTVRLLSDGRRW